MKNLYRRSSRRGFALLLTLIIVSFAAAIAVLFLLSARQERTGTDSYAQGSRVRQLADAAVNIVMGQINAATREGTAANPISWASQPGMIRTYKNDGTLSNAYKLYSWNNMIESAAANGTTGAPAFDPYGTTELPPTSGGTDWSSLPAVYTDLNAPVISSASGTPVSVYPIMDPSIANFTTSGGTSVTTASAVTWDFPNEVAVATDATGYKASATNTLPMPVQWLYVLQDGTWTYPDAASSTASSAVFDQGNVPTAANPIVGRIAFWTDDDTNKVNLNTAGEGAYWDWPKAASQDEMQFVGNPPGKNEFHRVSGHPATTSLSAVFPEVMGGISAFSRWSGSGANNPSFRTGLLQLLGNSSSSTANLVPGLSPRYAFGTGAFTGSQGGTFPVPYFQTYDPVSGVSAGTFSDNSTWVPASFYNPIPLFGYRLYATPDELFYSPLSGVAGVRGPSPGAALENQGLKAAGLSAQQVAQRFFLVTTNSRAPETTLFNTPRVSMWPITWPHASSYYIKPTAAAGTYLRGAAPSPPATLTPDQSTLAQLAAYTDASTKKHNIAPQEDLIAFCATLNSQNTAPNPYYFQRQDPDSPVNDWANIQRNRFLANYIRGEVKQKIPGFGDSLENQWTANNSATPNGANVADYITLECMDYCRSMVNQYTFDPNSSTGSLLYSFTGIAQLQVNFGTDAASNGQQSPNERMSLTATPLRIDPTSGAGLSPNYFTGKGPHNAGTEARNDAYVTQGSYPSLKEVAIEFMATQRRAPAYLGPTSPDMTPDPFYWANLINVGQSITTGSLTVALDQIGPSSPAAASASGSATGLTPASYPDGKYTSTGISNLMEEFNMYPVGAQTTSMQGIMLLDFAQLRDGINASPSPTFWVKVSGADGLLINGNPTNGFAPVMRAEYRGRASQGSSDTVFQTLYGKTFLDSNATGYTPAQPNWGLCTPQIPIQPELVAFPFSGTKFNVAIYAAYSATPDTDPTSDASQFVTSYRVDLTNYNGDFPIPIAPRWSVRQARNVPFPNPASSMTYINTSGTLRPTSDVSATQSTGNGWVATEIVPDIRNISNWGWTTSPSPGASGADKNFIRDLNNGFATYPAPYTADAGNQTSLDSLGTTGINWMMYATIYNVIGSSTTPVNGNPNGVISGTDVNTIPLPTTFTFGPSTPAPANTGTGWSMSMTRRITAISGTVVAAEGTPLPTGTGPTDPIGALWTNTSFNSGGGGVPNYAPEAITEITPYDTVISTIIDPVANSTQQGDPRLSNVTGENVIFDTSSAVMNHLSTSMVSSMVLNGYPPTTQASSIGGIVRGQNSASDGYRYFPRYTYEQQSHQLGNPASLSTMTGFQLIPMWTRTRQPPDAIGVKYLGLEGIYGGQFGLGSSEQYATMVGLDTNAFMMLSPDWDWTSTPGNAFDGGYIERPDQDYQTFFTAGTFATGLGTPYFSRSGNGSYSAAGPRASTSANFSPNRQVPSPIVFGTLPSSLSTGWQTLVFCPNPGSDMDSLNNPTLQPGKHPGVAVSALVANQTHTNAISPPYTANGNSGTSIPDHLLLDLFWMPVAEPYPMSEQFSTAGKVNLNYAMMPFPYIQRKSGLDAVLKSVWIYCIPDTNLIPQDYKSWYFMSPYATTGTGHGRSATNTRFTINVDATLAAFDYKFKNGDIFRSASQICDMFLYPNDPAQANTASPNTLLISADSGGSTANIRSWWNTNGKLTSDNGREAPYNAIYSRITTQSNTYTVHWKVQALHKVTANGASPTTWTEGFDRVTSELRGSTLIERYIDPNAGATTATNIPDYANPSVGSTAIPITYYYKWKVDNETYFQPPP